MKKLFMFLAVAGLATFGASCSSDDSKNDDPVKKDLVLSGKTDVKEGEAVTFTVKVGDKAETGTELYVDGVKAANPHTFSKVGKYSVQAKKKDFNDSNVLTVNVTEKDIVGPEPEPDPKTLVLSVVGGNEAIVGQEVIFLVKDNEGNNVTGATIKNGATTVANPWTPTEAGTVKFVASKEGYENSNEVSVVVSVVTVPESQFLKVGNEIVSLDMSKFIYFKSGEYVYSETLEDGTVIVPFRIDVEGDDSNLGRLLIYVVQTPGTTTVKFPWQAGQGDLGIMSYSGLVGGQAWEADDETGYGGFSMTDLNAGQGDGDFSVDVTGATVDGNELLTKYDGPIEGFYSIDLGGANVQGLKKGAKSSMAKVNAKDLKSLKRK